MGKNLKDKVTNWAGAGIMAGTILVLAHKHGYLAKTFEDLGLMLGGSGTAIVSYCTGKPNKLSEDASRPVEGSDAVEGDRGS